MGEVQKCQNGVHDLDLDPENDRLTLKLSRMPKIHKLVNLGYLQDIIVRFELTVSKATY